MEPGENKGPGLVAVTATLLFLSTIAVAARCYNQIVLMKRFQIEDWLAVLTWVVYAVFTGICCTAVYHGLGRRVEDVPVKQRPVALFYKYLGMSIYVLLSGLIKFVVGLYLVKLFAVSRQKWQTRLLWTLLVIVGVLNTAYFFISVFQCNPIERFWFQYDPDWPKSGRCLKTWIALASTYTVNIVNILSDFTLALLPISLVWNAKMDRRTKWSVVAILSVGSAASVCTIIRVPYVYQLLSNKEYLANFIDLGIWSATEIGLAIVASSAATLRPLFKSIKLLNSTNGHKSRKSRSTFHSRARSLQLFANNKKDEGGANGGVLGPGAPGAEPTNKSSGKLFGSFGKDTYGTDTNVTFSGSMGNKKSYATLNGTLGGDTLNDTVNDDGADGRHSPIHVQTTISIDIEKAEGPPLSPGQSHHPRYVGWNTNPVGPRDLMRTDSREMLMWEKREQQRHQRINEAKGRIAKLEEIGLDEIRIPEGAHSSRSPRSPFPMVFARENWPLVTESPPPAGAAAAAAAGPANPHSPTLPANHYSSHATTSTRHNKPLPPLNNRHLPEPPKPVIAQQSPGTLLPVPVEREEEVRRLSCPV